MCYFTTPAPHEVSGDNSQEGKSPSLRRPIGTAARYLSGGGRADLNEGGLSNASYASTGVRWKI